MVLHAVLGEAVEAYDFVYKIICHRFRMDLMQEGMEMFRARTLWVTARTCSIPALHSCCGLNQSVLKNA